MKLRNYSAVGGGGGWRRIPCGDGIDPPLLQLVMLI